MAQKRAAARPKPKLSEADMAVHVVSYLERLGYTTYKEVALNGGGSDRADIYGVHRANGMTLSVETKTTFSIKVIEQSWQWAGRAHMVYVAVPAMKNQSNRHFAQMLCSMLGIGVLEVDERGAVSAVSNALLHPTPKLPKLYEEQRDSVAGNANNEYVTPYKLTATQVMDFMASRKSAPIRDVVAGVRHHYKTPNTARASLAKLIAMGVMPGLAMHGNTVVNKQLNGL